jgi:signal transduction histidine kinase
MLQEFISANADAIVERTMQRLEGRVYPSLSTRELEHGVPLFLSQLIETLRLEATAAPFAADAIGSAAARHGAELFEAGFNVSQVVHDYGDICQAITEVAIERHAAITVEEFHTLNRCLDTAIAEAVTEHARILARERTVRETEHLGHAAHELRNELNTAILAFQTLKRGDVAINGSTGAILGRSLIEMRDVIGGALSEVRLAAGKHVRERLPVMTLLDEIAATGILHSEYRQIEFSVAPVDPELAVNGDPQLLASAVTNLLQNAFKYTPAGGHVSLRTYASEGRLFIDVKDECGGFPHGKTDVFHAFGDRRGRDRSGLGLGLSIARKAMRAHDGDIHIENVPGVGCVFTIDMPLADTPAGAPQQV